MKDDTGFNSQIPDTIDGWPTVLPNDDGIRPAGPADACFYCDEKVGQPHKRDCVVVHKLVRLRYIIEVEVEVPFDWGKAQIEFHRNDSTWCADNAIPEIEKEASKAEGCLCRCFKAEFVKVVEHRPKRTTKNEEEMAEVNAIRDALVDGPDPRD